MVLKELHALERSSAGDELMAPAALVFRLLVVASVIVVNLLVIVLCVVYSTPLVSDWCRIDCAKKWDSAGR